MKVEQNARLYFGFLDNPEPLNTAIAAGFQRSTGSPETRRSHRFGGRYENVYIAADRIPELGPVLAAARRLAGEILGLTGDRLRVGFWFNAMEPGERTQAHTHDDADEQLSGVYYVDVPADSGELVVHDRHSRMNVPPRAGMFVFFAPDLEHEVTENRSPQRRLSIGMNFGLTEEPSAVC